MKSHRHLTRYLLLLLVCAAMASPMAFARKKAEPKPEPKYPNTTRVEPDIKPSRGVNKILTKMYELAQQEGHEAEARQLAEQILSHAKASAYDRAIADQMLAYQYMDEDNYAKAIEYLQNAINENALPNNTHFSMMLQVAQMQQAEDQFDAANKTLERLINETKSDGPEFVGMRGTLLYQEDRCAEAVPLLKEAMSRAQSKGEKVQATWPQILIACYADMDQLPEAISVAKQQLADNPNDKGLIGNLSNLYVQAEQYDAAVQLLADAKARGLMTNAKDYDLLYKLYLNAQKEDLAIATIDEGLAKGILQPSEEVYRSKADAFYYTDRSKEAIEWYGKAAELSQSGENNLNQARLLFDMDRYAEAKAAAKLALQKGLKRAGDAWVVIGGAELGLKDKPAAIAAYKKAASYPETKKSAEQWLRASGIR